MRQPSPLLALCALVFAAPARAELLPYTLSGTISGTQTTVVCVPNDPACLVTTPFTQPFAFTLGLDLEPGLNEFQFGSPLISAFSGTILNEDDELSGLDMIFEARSCMPGNPPVGCFWRTGAAATFVVQQGAGVPEPATWLFMLLGFGWVGIRQRAKYRQVTANIRFGSETDIARSCMN